MNSYVCPVCCNETFSSKHLLLVHLLKVIQNLYCPICKNKWSSVVHLIEHLSIDNCQPDNTVNSDVATQNDQQTNDVCQQPKQEQTSQINLVNQYNDNALDSTLNANSFKNSYINFISNQATKSVSKNQEIKLVTESEEDTESYILVTQGDLNSETIVTKQNNDGTISLTTVKDIKVESEALKNIEDNQEELYSCNTCGVSFSSVLEHIQSYHNDQDVVLEEPFEDTDNAEEAIPIQYETVNSGEEPESTDLVITRRVITDTGDIVETPSEDAVLTSDNETPDVDTQERNGTRRFVKVNKLCQTIIKDIKQDEKFGPYHKVIIKEVKTTSGKILNMYHCMSCNIYVSSLNEFQAHPCKTLKYPCPHCPVSYENSKSLCAHMKVHKAKISDGLSPDDQTVTFECEVCCTVFPTNKSLKLHKRMHDPIKSRPIEVPVATADGSKVINGKYLCNVCDKMIPINYRAIHNNSHKTNNKLNCSICNKKFISMEYLDMHMTVHNVDKVPVNKQNKSLPYNCIFCDRRFARPHEKVKHERIHTGEKPHSCEICGKSFRVSYCLTLHMRTHTGARPYACPHCDKRFKAHSVFNHHLLTHSDVRAYKCPYCPKAFKTSVQLAGHKNSHTKPFSCQQCNRPFASLYAVRAHTETHARLNNLKFSCELCGASYARAFALKDHMKQAHQDDCPATIDPLKEDSKSTENMKFKNLKDGLQEEINVLTEMDSDELIVP